MKSHWVFLVNPQRVKFENENLEPKDYKFTPLPKPIIHVSSPRIPARGDLVSIFVTSWTNARGQMASPPNAFDGLASASRWWQKSLMSLPDQWTREVSTFSLSGLLDTLDYSSPWFQSTPALNTKPHISAPTFLIHFANHFWWSQPEYRVSTSNSIHLELQHY